MSKNDPVEVRIEKMAEWAANTQAQIKELQARLVPDVAECDAISVELGDLYQQQSDLVSLLGESEKRYHELSAQLGYNDEMEMIEAQVGLDVSMAVNDMGKPKYSNETMRGQATKIKLNGHDRYQELRTERRKVELELVSVKATNEEIERNMSLCRGRARALVARLENLTARLSK